jgi:hypothetical protein
MSDGPAPDPTHDVVADEGGPVEEPVVPDTGAVQADVDNSYAPDEAGDKGDGAGASAVPALATAAAAAEEPAGGANGPDAGADDAVSSLKIKITYGRSAAQLGTPHVCIQPSLLSDSMFPTFLPLPSGVRRLRRIGSRQ